MVSNASSYVTVSGAGPAALCAAFSAAMHCRSSARKSVGVWMRRSTSFSSIRRRTATTPAGSTASASNAGTLSRCCAMTLATEPMKVGLPVSMNQSVTPSE